MKRHIMKFILTAILVAAVFMAFAVQTNNWTINKHDLDRKMAGLTPSIENNANGAPNR